MMRILRERDTSGVLKAEVPRMRLCRGLGSKPSRHCIVGVPLKTPVWLSLHQSLLKLGAAGLVVALEVARLSMGVGHDWIGLVY